MKKRERRGNVIKLSPETPPGKMESETAWEKALCRLFFCASKEKAYSKQSGWNILLKNVHGNRVKPELTSFCYRMLGSIDDADDAVQETFIRVWQSWHSFRQDSSFQTWVYRIASNLCLDKLRQAKRRTRPVDLSDPAVLIVELREKFPDSAWISRFGLPAQIHR